MLSPERWLTCGSSPSLSLSLSLSPAIGPCQFPTCWSIAATAGSLRSPLTPQEYPPHEGLCFCVCGGGGDQEESGCSCGVDGSLRSRPPHPVAAQLPFHPLFFLVSLSGPEPSTFAQTNARSLLRAGVFVWGGHRGAGQLRPGDHHGVDTGELGSDPSTFAQTNARSLLRAKVFVWG